MKTAVYKYPFEINREFALEMPAPAEIVHVALQDGTPCIWAVVWPQAGAVITRKFRIYGTGHDWDDMVNMKHHGTLMPSSGVVWHVFEVEPWNAERAMRTHAKEQKP